MMVDNGEYCNPILTQYNSPFNIKISKILTTIFWQEDFSLYQLWPDRCRTIKSCKFENKKLRKGLFISYVIP